MPYVGWVEPKAKPNKEPKGLRVYIRVRPIRAVLADGMLGFTAGSTQPT